MQLPGIFQTHLCTYRTTTARVDIPGLGLNRHDDGVRADANRPIAEHGYAARLRDMAIRPIVYIPAACRVSGAILNVYRMISIDRECYQAQVPQSISPLMSFSYD